MKSAKAFIFAASLSMAFATQLSPAQAASAAPTATVEQLMKDFGRVFKSISEQVAAGDLGLQTQKNVDLLAKLATDSKAIVPGSFGHLSEAESKDLFVKYQAQMQIFIDQVQVLKSAAVAGDQQAALASLKRLGELKGQGHGDFRHP